MSSLWQEIVALTLVATASAWLVRRAWRTFALKSGCTGCGSCSGKSQGSKTPVQTIVLLTKNAESQDRRAR